MTTPLEMTEEEKTALIAVTRSWGVILKIPDLSEAERQELARHLTGMQNIIIARQFWRTERARKQSQEGKENGGHP